MSDETIEHSPRPLPGRVARVFSGLLLIVSGVFLLASLSELRKIGVPAAPTAYFYGAIAVASAAVLLNIPPLFKRLPGRARLAAYIAPILAFIAFGIELGQMQPAWEATAEGAKEATERAAAARKAAMEQEQRDQTARSLAEAEAVKDQLSEIQAKLEACFTSFGHRLPALEEPVKESLHNPAAFEHVSTVLIVPDEQRNDVEMTFRAENAFGAIRTARVRAQLIADDCSVQHIGEPQID